MLMLAEAKVAAINSWKRCRLPENWALRRRRTNHPVDRMAMAAALTMITRRTGASSTGWAASPLVQKSPRLGVCTEDMGGIDEVSGAEFSRVYGQVIRRAPEATRLGALWLGHGNRVDRTMSEED